ncbi:vacuolar protein sorting-associated protein 22 homolog 1-like [Mangifera indica]|uniref:vacuolar protein sorting-associated protein 22 homolog 1-like n=1 Tax=Mangifera indica TaxID=29780 RepID=UPI001CFB6A79|nr:vacuolar protein sorting-associated protein 22 homolog 1-like [Mangifera indica]
MFFVAAGFLPLKLNQLNFLALQLQVSARSCFINDVLVIPTSKKTRVQIVEICLATRPHNDCLRPISKLKAMGSGFEVISGGKKKLVGSVPAELNRDHNQILELAQAQGFVTVDEVERQLSWTTGRAIDALDVLLDEGLAMIDEGHRDGRRWYWFACVSSIKLISLELILSIMFPLSMKLY